MITFKNYNITLKELFQLFYRICKYKNIDIHSSKNYNVKGELITFDLNKGLGNWIRCTQDQMHSIDVGAFYDFLQNYNSDNLKLIMYKLDMFLKENLLKEDYEKYIINAYCVDDPYPVIKLLACLGVHYLVRSGDVYENEIIHTQWMEYADDLTNLIA